MYTFLLAFVVSSPEDRDILFWFKFGGGRTLQPGDSIETAEEKIAREARTKKLLTAYKESIGLNIDPKLKLECEKVLPRHFCSSFLRTDLMLKLIWKLFMWM